MGWNDTRTVTVAFEDDLGAWLVNVNVGRLHRGSRDEAGGQEIEILQVAPDVADKDAAPDAAALERLLADPKALERVELDAVEQAGEDEAAAQEAAWEARADWAREECR